MTTTIDFEDLSSGTPVLNQYSSHGVTISGITAGGAAGRAMIFDSAQPTGGDADLATESNGKVLIISEDGDSADPDDNGRGGILRFDFDRDVHVDSLTFIDAEEGAVVDFYSRDGLLLDSFGVETIDNGIHIAEFLVDGVARMEVTLAGSGAVDALVFDAGIALRDGTVEGTQGDDIITPDGPYTDADGDAVDSADGLLPGAEGTDKDEIHGLDGDDVIAGGADEDTLFGGAGKDILTGGAGADVVDGGADADTIVAGAGDVVRGGAAGDDRDTLDLRGQGNFVLTGPDGTGGPVADSNGNGFDGRVYFLDETGARDGRTVDFREIETILADRQTGPGPRPVDDAFFTGEDDPATLGNVLANDSEGDLLVSAVNGERAQVGQPVAGDNGGLVTISAGGIVTFDPTDAFNTLRVGETLRTAVRYRVEDARGDSAEAQLVITVTGSNDGPRAEADVYDVISDDAAGDVDGAALANDSDPEAEPLVILAVAGDPANVGQPVPGSHGGLFIVQADGTVDFDANGDFEGLSAADVVETSVSYTISDGSGGTDTSEITFTVSGKEGGSVVGTDGDDVIDTGAAGAPDVGYPFQRPEAGFGNTIPFPGYAADTNRFDNRDIVAGGAGDDTIHAGDDDDTIYGGTGDDRIDGGFDDDVIFGGAGDDILEGSEGNDLIDGGAGDDRIYGGLEDAFADRVSFPDDQPDANGFRDLVPENNGDRLFGGDGDDRLWGQDDDDTLFGGRGDDYLDGGVDDDMLAGDDGDDTILGNQGNDRIIGGKGGDRLFGGAGADLIAGNAGDDVIAGGIGDDALRGGAGDDAIDGGAGNDRLRGGRGADALFGGQGSDRFDGATAGDVVVGGEAADGSDIDVLDLTGARVDRITYTSTERESGEVVFDDGRSMTFAEIEQIVPCFTPGTLIATPRGERKIEDLRVGDRVITRDNGIQEIAWIGRKHLTGREIIQQPNLRPVLIKRGALGQGLPERDMMVSPNHRMLVSSEKTQLYFEETEVLAAAKHMVGADGIHAVDPMQTTYIHFMFERHEVVLANGAWSESFQPGDYALGGVADAQRDEILSLFPDLQTAKGRAAYKAARKSLKRHEAELLQD